MYNQPSHEMKYESKLIIFYISLVVKDLKEKYDLEEVCLNQKVLTCFVIIGYSFKLKVFLLPEITF